MSVPCALLSYCSTDFSIPATDLLASSACSQAKRRGTRRQTARLGNQRPEHRRRQRKCLIEVACQQCEVLGVDDVVVVEIALRPRRTGAEVGRKSIEIERVYRPIEIRVAKPRRCNRQSLGSGIVDVAKA